MSEHRRARRILLSTPVIVEVVGQPEMSLPPEVEKVYRRVEADRSAIGRRFPGVVRDLSTNGAFVATEPVPLMSRLAMQFDFDGHKVDALAWVLWKREADCSIQRADGQGAINLPRGIGVMFEAIPLEVRIAIARKVG
ncbi:MAG: PilZ domain-containing protein [Kofleriaceae bacterium]|nr:PilZ domain-containing protein [Myxococcales bacterium]MCB9562739.1 PilZ domain-containing protein [Kofleriaceae bacterium]MCB9571061.1 PilZ domain-containing protein [Kofleriaceae bacterium]